MACVYWIRLPEHTDIFSQGYVGVTKKTLSKRYGQHVQASKKNPNLTHLSSAINKYSDRLIASVVLIAEEEYCYDVENKLRPDIKIGWNLCAGGRGTRKGMPVTCINKKKISSSSKDNWANNEIFKDRMRNIAVESRIEESPRSGFWRYGRGNISTMIGDADIIYSEYIKDTTVYAKELLQKLGKDTSSNNIHYVLTLFRKFSGGWIPLEDILWLHEFKDSSLAVPDYLKYPEGWIACQGNTSVWLAADVIYGLVLMGFTANNLGNLYDKTREPFRVIVKRIRNGWIPLEDPRWVKWRNEQFSLTENT